jgi:hypothetical protein
MLTIFGPRTTAIAERNGLVGRDRPTPRELRFKCIGLLALQWHNDANVFAAPGVDDSDRCGECEERNRRNPRKLLWGDMRGH